MNSSKARQEYTKLKTYLISWERPDLVDKITEIFGEDVDKRTSEEIIADLLAWMMEFPKGV